MTDELISAILIICVIFLVIFTVYQEGRIMALEDNELWTLQHLEDVVDIVHMLVTQVEIDPIVADSVSKMIKEREKSRR